MPANSLAGFPLRFFQNFLTLHPDLDVISPTDPEWIHAQQQYYINYAERPSTIARPRYATQIQDLIRLCASYNVEFVIRTGGHDCAGRSQVNGALAIDMRNIQYVHVSEDRQTARGIRGLLHPRESAMVVFVDGKLIRELSAPLGSVGYVGWATLGGYSPLMAKYGLGVDQIVGARYVNGDGELIEADQEALVGIRGGGGSFGVITELTIKILTGNLIFEQTDKQATWFAYAENYQRLLDSGHMPRCLSLQPAAVAIPNVGNVLSISATWADANHDEGHRWFQEIANWGICLMKSVKPTTWHMYCAENEKLASSQVHGRARTLNFRQLTPRTISILAEYNASIPGPGSLIAAQHVRLTEPGLPSVFNPRGEYYWLEIVGTSRDPNVGRRADEWARALKQKLLENDPGNILDSAYVGFLDNNETDLARVYGSNCEALLAIKKKLDEKNIFKNTVPNLNI
ncbi:hypothetical protein NM208_g9230 [Fusarium decemcellulare]|uniref:Uncharacterized protein n=1 Tax=Fusarium decemcellulare TaxID=57161 RepID=A0ACC1S2P6_9HYPO|nr:hypothetical protein NM208_g9230 [Fusarium decemcellulare]